MHASDRTPPAAPPSKNRLAAEPSLYLRMHGDNPVDWYPWGAEALARARALDRPIFLSSGYASCHWCHVMEREVFSDPEVAALLNAHFVAIKLDREERPDLDAAFMDAVQSLTGSGGWPLSVFLTPERVPFFGGTYFPRADFLFLLERLHVLFTQNRGLVEEQGERLRAFVQQRPTVAPGADLDAARLAALAAAAALGEHDPAHGGPRGRTKFPTPPRWRMLLGHVRRTGAPDVAAVLRQTLDAMAAGGLYDPVGGGFHRYATEPTWTVPHFEKMLYDNAQLASLFAEAAVVLGEPRYAAVARDTLDFVLAELTTAEGAFAASVDADSAGGEGAFYVWTPADVAAAVGPADGPVLAALLGVDAAGNFEGDRSVLTRRADPSGVAARFGRDPAEVAALFQRHRPALSAFRARRPAPRRDDKVVTAWNALTVSALLAGHALTGAERYRAAAVTAADFLWQAHWRPTAGLCRASNAGVPAGPAIVDDYAAFALACFDLFSATGDAAWLPRGFTLVDRALTDFAAPDGTFYLTAAGTDAPLGRRSEILESVEPAGQALLALALLKAHDLSDRAPNREAALRALTAHAGLFARAGLGCATSLAAAALAAGPRYTVVVAGAPGAPATEALLAACRGALLDHATLIPVPAGGAAPELLALVPAAALKTAPPNEAVAHVCTAGRCLLPTVDAAEVLRQVATGYTR